MPTKSFSVTHTPSEISIDAVIDELGVRSVFQPIVHLGSGTIAGFEALSRGPAATELELPLALLKAAQEAGRLADLDWLCRVQALRTIRRAGLPDSLSWLINVEPAGLAIGCPPHLAVDYQAARAELRVVLEIVERDLEGRTLDLLRAADDARRSAWGVALDDVGADEASLALLPFLRPDIVKLDMSLVQSVPRKKAAAVTAAVRAYAERYDAVILAEGVETHAHQQLAQVFGATYGQGYFYGKPEPLPDSLEPPSHPIPMRQSIRPLDGQTPYEISSRSIAPQRAEAKYLNTISADLESRLAEQGDAAVLLAGFQRSEFFTAAKRARYRQLSGAVALTVVAAAGLESHDKPGHYIVPLSDGSPLAAEWLVIALSPHFAAALVARAHDSSSTGSERLYDFVYTHDRDVVVDAARSFILQLENASGDRESTTPAIEQEFSRNLDRRQLRHSRAAFGELDRADKPHLLPPIPGTDTGGLSPADAVAGSYGFRATSQIMLDYLKTNFPMAFWSITRLENGRQTFVYLDDNEYGLSVGDGHPWRDSYCQHMASGAAPRIAPDAAAIPLYANAAVNRAVRIGAYAGAPIAEPDGSLFGAICGLDQVPRDDLERLGPTLDLLAQLLTLSLAADRALIATRADVDHALVFANTDALTGIHNRRAWDVQLEQLAERYKTFADPTVIVIVDLDDFKAVNDGPGGHTAGDKLLREAARLIGRYIRKDDFLARIGGDEFGIILASTDASAAPTLVQRLSRALGHGAIPASFGWSEVTLSSNVYQAVERADASMYAAKASRASSRRRAKS